MRYIGRPGIPAAVAVLLAQGLIQPSQRILDVGCGTGTDALLLARWGCRRVDGIDPDADAIRIARGRATRQGLADRALFHHLGAEDLGDAFAPATFDVALHTLVANNLVRGKDRHFAALARALKPHGLLVVHERTTAECRNAMPGAVEPIPALAKHFTLSRSVSTQLPEQPAGRRGGAADVAVWLGAPKPAQATRRKARAKA